MEGYVKISDFMNHLKENNLLIVSKNDFVAATEEDFNLKRSRLLKQRAVTLHEIVEGRLLPLTTKQGIRHWIEKGIIQQSEVMKSRNGTIKILTSAIKRLGYE